MKIGYTSTKNQNGSEITAGLHSSAIVLSHQNKTPDRAHPIKICGVLRSRMITGYSTGLNTCSCIKSGNVDP